MLTLLKKKSEKTPVLMVPDWHPNFRNFDRLPDTKVVRTAFFINAGSLLVSVGLLLYFSYQEYSIHNLKLQIAEWQKQIDTNQKAADTAVAHYKQFQDLGKKFGEAEAYVQTRLPATTFLLGLGRTLPKSVALDSIDLGPTGCAIRGVLHGNSEEASGLASSYVQQLKADPLIKSLFSDVTINSLDRDTANETLHFEFSLKYKDQKKP